MNFRNKAKKLFLSILFLLLLCMFNVIKAGASDLTNDKPLFVIVSTDWCYACKKLHPIIEELEAQYKGQVNFLSLDASSDDTVNASRQIAAQYGLAAYFDSNRNVFPKVGILCSGSTAPEKIITGAYGKETYIEVINTFILDPNKTCNTDGRPVTGINSPEQSSEPEMSEIVTSGRPDIPNLSDRPNEGLSSGRPDELNFWLVGQPVPLYAYYQYLLIPRCSSGNDILCSSNALIDIRDVKEPGGTGFKPYDPNATRNEKGLHLKK